jgi:hypothetical protein
MKPKPYRLSDVCLLYHRTMSVTRIKKTQRPPQLGLCTTGLGPTLCRSRESKIYYSYRFLMFEYIRCGDGIIYVVGPSLPMQYEEGSQRDPNRPKFPGVLSA